MNQDWEIRGQAVQRKCPKCHGTLRWSLMHGSAERIAKARNRHFGNCPAAELDPKRLAEMSKAEVETALNERDTDDTNPASSATADDQRAGSRRHGLWILRWPRQLRRGDA